MKYVHGTDNKKDIVWIVSNYIAFVIFYLVNLGLCFLLLWNASSVKNDPIGLMAGFGCLLMFSLGIMDASWRNEKYEINETGIFIKGLTQKKDVHWDSIRSCGVFPIKMIPSGMPRDYIVFFLSDYRPSFPVDLAFCSIHRRKMLVIRATTERIEEIKKSTTRHHIIWKNANDGYGTWDGQ